MHPQELIGKYAIRKTPAKIPMDTVTVPNMPAGMSMGTVFYDHLFTVNPIFILAATDDHIVYLDINNVMEHATEILDDEECEECGCAECEEKCEEDPSTPTANPVGMNYGALMPKILNFCYVDNDWKDYEELMMLARNYDLIGNLFNDLKHSKDNKKEG